MKFRSTLFFGVYKHTLYRLICVTPVALSIMQQTSAYEDFPGERPVSLQEKFDRLLRWHLAAAIVHAAQAGVLFGLARTWNEIDQFWTQYKVWDKNVSPRVQSTVLFGAKIELFPPIFLAMAALDHACCAYLWVWSDYKLQTAKGTASLCWLEYAFSASLMNSNILQLCGNNDIVAHGLVWICTALCMVEGYWVEKLLEQGKVTEAKWHFLQGCIPFLAVWTVIFAYFFDNATDAPAFVYAIVVVLFLLESMFAVNMVVFIYSQRTPSDIYNYEWTKIVLSITAKASLAWIQFGGTRASSSSSS